MVQLIVIILEGPKDGDLLSFGSRFDRLGTTLEEVECLSRLLYEYKREVS